MLLYGHFKDLADIKPCETLEECQGRLNLTQNRRFKIPQKDFSVLPNGTEYPWRLSGVIVIKSRSSSSPARKAVMSSSV